MAIELHPAGGWGSQHAGWSSKKLKVGQTGTFTGTKRRLALGASHLGSFLLIKSFYYNMKHPAKMTTSTRKTAYSSVVYQKLYKLLSSRVKSCVCAILV